METSLPTFQDLMNPVVQALKDLGGSGTIEELNTGNFTKDAVREATRDGAPAIDLIDGDLLLDKLRELGLGVKTEVVEVKQITVDEAWFAGV